ncbi:MAG: hypothetical protein ACQKBW_04460 [Puniceicoccales bacterium]
MFISYARAFTAFLALCLLGSLPAWAQEQQLRTFELKDGHSINARIHSANNGQVVLERTDKLTFTLPVDALSLSDQDYVREWSIADKLANGKLFKLSGVSKITDLKTQREEGLITYTWTCVYECKVENASPYELAGIKLNLSYASNPGRIVQPREEKATTPPVSQRTEYRITQIEPGKSLTFTEKLPLSAIVLEDGWTWPDGGDKPVADQPQPLQASLTFQGQPAGTFILDPAMPEFLKAADKASTAPAQEQQ